MIRYILCAMHCFYRGACRNFKKSMIVDNNLDLILSFGSSLQLCVKSTLETCLTNTEQKKTGNPTWKMHYSELTNWWRANWQTGGGAKSALVPSRNQLHKFWQAYPRLTLPLIPTMYDTWGGTSRILGARGLRKKLSPVEGFRPPTHYVVWVGEPD